MKDAVSQFRDRKKRQGFVRVEAQVRAEDAEALRLAARTLSDPKRGPQLKQFLASQSPGSVSAKNLLASAPLDGIKLTRSRGKGRTVTF